MNGIIDAGGGVLVMEAGSSIIMGSNARGIGEKVFLQAGGINLGGVIEIGSGSNIFLRAGNVSSGNIDLGAGGAIALRSPARVPEPGTLRLLLPGFVLLAFRKAK